MNRRFGAQGVGMTLVAGLALLAGPGCAMFRARTGEVDVAKPRHLGAGYDYTDMRQVSQAVADELAASAFLARAPEPPVVMIAGVENRTSQYLDTKALTDRLRGLLLQSGKARFVNEARRDELMRERGFQQQHVKPEAQVEMGKLLGAKWMVSGALSEMKSETPRQIRVSKTKVSYYKLTVELTDLATGEIAWMTEKEFARETRLPLIGW